MHLDGIVKEKSYLADAISSNTNLGTTHFDDFHNYTIEWKPSSPGQEDGYISWYIDGIFRYRITSKTLAKTGGLIPEEPMYLILNTAISSTWGFPVPCPDGCSCNCFDARREECECGIPANMRENFPADYLVDYIRVYQDKR